MSAPLTDEDKGFIRSILDHPEELTTWLAYADWLDDRSDPRSEFLRLTVQRKQLAPDAITEALDARLAVLRAELNHNWILAFDTPPVGNCPNSNGWRFRCPMTWDALSPTDEPDIRICHECKSPVFFCNTLEEARQFASCGQCVALTTRIPNEENPFIEQEMITAGVLEFDTDEFPLPLLDGVEGVHEGDIETVELPWREPGVEEVPPPPPHRPWWKFW